MLFFLHRSQRFFRLLNGKGFRQFGTTTSRRTSLSRKFLFATGLAGSGLLAYDGAVNNFGYVGATKRFLRSSKIVVHVGVDYYWHLRDLNENSETYKKLLKEIHQRSADRILKGCLANGGLYIKIGQGVSAINHILPVEYIKTLSRLQNECLPSTEDDVRKVFVEDFGAPPEEVFQEFNYSAIAAASLAQVFKAKLKTGEEVAVKVQYGDLQKRFSTDLGTIMFLQDMVELVFKNYNFGWILRDLRKTLEQELDFVNEGKNAERCSRDLSKFKFVHVPEVHWDFTKTRVLTAEWIEGFKITDKDKLKEQKINLHDVDTKLFSIFSEQIFNSGFVHADPHPGNVFVRKNKSGKVELVVLDHGLYQYLPENIRGPLCNFWEATVLKDEERMKRSANQLNINNYENFAEVLFQTPFKIKGSNLKTKLTDEDIEYMQNIAKHHFEKIMDTLKEMPRNILLVVRNLNTIRAISREHGDPVERPKFMARYAQKCLYKNERLGYFRWIVRRCRFEFSLMKTRLQLFIISVYFDVLYKLGRSPEDSKILKIQIDV